MVSMVGDTSRLAEEWQLWNLLPQPLCHRGVRLVPQGDEVPPVPNKIQWYVLIFQNQAHLCN